MLFARLAHPEAGELHDRPAAGLLRLRVHRYTRGMSVAGGRPWRAGLVFGAAWLALAAAACGGRTSTLDPDVYENDPPDEGSGGSSTAGTGSTPTAGKSSSPKAGSGPGGSGADINTAKVCDGYCGGYEQKCPERLDGGECRATCAQEMTGFGPACNNLGTAALNCLSPFFKDGSLSCDTAVRNALTNCRQQVDAFDACKSGDPEPQPPQPIPTPTPTPTPQPNPMPTQYPGYCGGMGEQGTNHCKDAYACAEGVYTVSCVLNAGGMLYDCSCTWPNGAGQGFFLIYPNPSACQAAATQCGFLPPILK
jgi:hypothetical protein